MEIWTVEEKINNTMEELRIRIEDAADEMDWTAMVEAQAEIGALREAAETYDPAIAERYPSGWAGRAGSLEEELSEMEKDLEAAMDAVPAETAEKRLAIAEVFEGDMDGASFTKEEVDAMALHGDILSEGQAGDFGALIEAGKAFLTSRGLLVMEG